MHGKFAFLLLLICLSLLLSWFTATWIIYRDCLTENKEVEDIARWLTANYGSLIGDTELDRVVFLVNYLYSRIAYDYFKAANSKIQRLTTLRIFSDPDKTLEIGKGMCSDKAVLLASILVETGFKPGDIKLTYGSLRIGNTTLNSHTWVELKLDNEWFSLDPTTGVMGKSSALVNYRYWSFKFSGVEIGRLDLALIDAVKLETEAYREIGEKLSVVKPFSLSAENPFGWVESEWLLTNESVRENIRSPRSNFSFFIKLNRGVRGKPRREFFPEKLMLIYRDAKVTLNCTGKGSGLKNLARFLGESDFLISSMKLKDANNLTFMGFKVHCPSNYFVHGKRKTSFGKIVVEGGNGTAVIWLFEEKPKELRGKALNIKGKLIILEEGARDRISMLKKVVPEIYAALKMR